MIGRVSSVYIVQSEIRIMLSVGLRVFGKPRVIVALTLALELGKRFMSLLSWGWFHKPIIRSTSGRVGSSHRLSAFFLQFT